MTWNALITLLASTGSAETPATVVLELNARSPTTGQSAGVHQVTKATRRSDALKAAASLMLSARLTKPATRSNVSTHATSRTRVQSMPSALLQTTGHSAGVELAWKVTRLSDVKQLAASLTTTVHSTWHASTRTAWTRASTPETALQTPSALS